jgi:hypothetical protein
MDTVLDLYDALRSAMPGAFDDADRLHMQNLGSLSPEYTYSWFESLAAALNQGMARQDRMDRYSGVVAFMAGALKTASAEVRNCIDVAFVENLFWQVPAAKASGYWAQLPQPLRELYLAFHGRAPT